jgi:hypothetical protein
VPTDLHGSSIPQGHDGSGGALLSAAAGQQHTTNRLDLGSVHLSQLDSVKALRITQGERKTQSDMQHDNEHPTAVVRHLHLHSIMNKELYLDKNAVAHWLHSLELHQRVVVKVTRESSLVRGIVVVSGGLSNLLETKPCAAARQVKVAMHTKPTEVDKRHLLRQRRGRHATKSSAPALSNCLHDALLVAGLDHLAMEQIHATETRRCLRLNFERAAPPKN